MIKYIDKRRHYISTFFHVLYEHMHSHFIIHGNPRTGTTTATTRNAHQFLFLLLVISNKICATLRIKSDNKFAPLSAYIILLIGTPSSQFVTGPSSPSPRVSIKSNNSTSPNIGNWNGYFNKTHKEKKKIIFQWIPSF